MRRWPAAAMVRRQSQGAACGAGEVTNRRVQGPRGGGDRPAWSGAAGRRWPAGGRGQGLEASGAGEQAPPRPAARDVWRRGGQLRLRRG